MTLELSAIYSRAGQTRGDVHGKGELGGRQELRISQHKSDVIMHDMTFAEGEIQVSTIYCLDLLCLSFLGCTSEFYIDQRVFIINEDGYRLWHVCQ